MRIMKDEQENLIEETKIRKESDISASSKNPVNKRKKQNFTYFKTELTVKTSSTHKTVGQLGNKYL